MTRARRAAPLPRPSPVADRQLVLARFELGSYVQGWMPVGAVLIPVLSDAGGPDVHHLPPFRSE